MPQLKIPHAATKIPATTTERGQINKYLKQTNKNIKNAVRYCLTPVRKAIIKKTRNNKCWRECGEKGTLVHRWWECKLVQPLWKTVWRFLKKLRIELPYDLAIPLLGIYPKKMKTLI